MLKKMEIELSSRNAIDRLCIVNTFRGRVNDSDFGCRCIGEQGAFRHRKAVQNEEWGQEEECRNDESN